MNDARESRAPGGPGSGRAPLRRWLSILLWVAAIAFLVRTARGVGWELLGERLGGVDRGLLGLTLLVNLLRYAVWAERWRVLLRPVERVPWWAAQKALMASLFFTTVVPASRPLGGLVRARRLSRETGRPLGALYGGALVDQVGYSVVSLTLGAVCLPFALMQRSSGVGRDRVLFLVAAAVVVAALLVLWRRRGGILERIRRRLPHLADVVEDALGAARTLMARPITWCIMAGGGFLVWTSNVLVFHLAARALGLEMSLTAAASAFAIGSFAGTVTGTPGGAGTTELAAIAPLVALGVSTDAALASVLLARGVHYLCALLIGGYFTLRAPRPVAPPESARSAGRDG